MKRSLLGVTIDDLTKTEFLRQIVALAKSQKNGNIVFRPNAETITFATKDKNFQQILNSADLSIPDGVGVLLASKILDLGIKTRFGGPESMLDILKVCEKEGFRVYFLGGEQTVVEKAVENVKKSLPKLRIIGFHHGFFSDDEEIISEMNKLKPDMVFVGMGFPRQEKLISKVKNKLQAKVLISEGGSFDYLAGKTRRAPVFIRKIGFDWLFRLINEPWRLKRQSQLVKFIFLVLREKFWA